MPAESERASAVYQRRSADGFKCANNYYSTFATPFVPLSRALFLLSSFALVCAGSTAFGGAPNAEYHIQRFRFPFSAAALALNRVFCF